MQRRRFVLGFVHTALFSTTSRTRLRQPAASSLGLHLEVLYAELRPARLGGPGGV